MDLTHSSARLWLQQEFEERKRKNPSYSLRAFARLLQLPSGRLSEILSGSRGISQVIAQQIAARLNLDPVQKARFVSVAEAKKRGPKKPAPTGAASWPTDSRYVQLSTDSFYAIADWYHYAILNLIETHGFRNQPGWIAKRLGISPTIVRGALERLERLQLIESRAGKVLRTGSRLTTTEDIESSALKRSHRQTLEQAIEALDTVAVQCRDISSVTMAISPKRLREAKEKIRKFRRELSSFLECDDAPAEKRTEVYNLNVQLVPVTRPSGVKTK